MNNSTTPTPKSQAPGRALLFPDVNCVTFSGAVGEYKLEDLNFFDVPKEEFTEGNLTGYKTAWQVLKSAKNGNFDSFQSILIAAVDTMNSTDKAALGGVDQRGCAIGFMESICEMLIRAVKELDIDTLMTEKVHGYEAMLQLELDATKKENGNFIAAMMKKPRKVVTS